MKFDVQMDGEGLVATLLNRDTREALVSFHFHGPMDNLYCLDRLNFVREMIVQAYAGRREGLEAWTTLRESTAKYESLEDFLDRTGGPGGNGA